MADSGVAFERTRKLRKLADKVEQLVMKEFSKEAEEAFKELQVKPPNKDENVLERVKTLKNFFAGEQKPVVAIAGQIKSGKTTLINALFFRDEVLPTSVSPETARLTIIKWGEKRKADVKFYSHDEWDEIVDKSKEEDFRWAKEMVDFASKSLGSEIDKVLGTSREVEWDELEDYVSEKGKYSYVVKEAVLYLEHDILRSLDIVDTPGLDDPIEARSRTTEEFLSRANAVVYCTAPVVRFMDSRDIGFLADFISKVFLHKSVVTAVTRIDQLRREERARLKDMIRRASERVRKASMERGYGENLTEEMCKVFHPDRMVEVAAALYLVGIKMKKGRPLREKDWTILRRARHNGWEDDPEQLIKKSGVELLEKKLDTLIVKNALEIMRVGALNSLMNRLEEVQKRASEGLEGVKEEISILERGLRELEESLQARKKALEDLQTKSIEFRAEVRDKLLEYRKLRTLPRPQIRISSDDIVSEKVMKERFSLEIKRRIEDVSLKEIKRFQDELDEIKESLKGVSLDFILKSSIVDNKAVVRLRDAIVDCVNRAIEYATQGAHDRMEKLKIDLSGINTGFLGWRRWFARSSLRRDVENVVNEVLSDKVRELSEKFHSEVNEVLESIENAVTGALQSEIESRLSRIRNDIDALQVRKEEKEEALAKTREQYEYRMKLMEILKREIDERISMVKKVKNSVDI